MNRKLREKKVGTEEVIRKIDLPLLVSVIALVIFGCIMVYSATCSRTDNPFLFLRKQVIWVLLGTIAMVAIALSNYNYLRNYTGFIYGVTIFLLMVVAIVGVIESGGQRWISIFGFSFQPSEFAKVALIIILAAFLATLKGDISSPRDLGLTFLYFGIPVVLIAGQPDLGTALVIFAILMGMLLAGGTRLKYYLIIIGICIALGFISIHFKLLAPHQMNRLLVFINPSLDPQGAGYNLLQSKIAVGSGGFFGKGLFSGTQAYLRFLPFTETDFIFSVIGEELGFFGALILLGLYFVLISRGIRIAGTAKNMFGALIAVGITSMWIFQILVNIGMTIGIMPITGIPLPFISYGGSAMMTNLVAVGLLLSIYNRRFE